MIFPHVRISDLEKDVQEKREALDQSQAEASHQIRHKLKPINFFTDHYKLIITTLFTVLPVWRFLFNLGGKSIAKKKTSIFWKLLKAGWTWKALMKGGGYMIKNRGKEISNFLFSIFK